MIRRLAIGFVLVALGALGAPAYAQPGTAQPGDDAPIPATKFDPTTCEKTKPAPSKTQDIDIKNVAIEVRWKEYVLTGDFVDPPETVRQLMDPVMESHHSITDEARDRIEEAAASFGYQVVGLGTRETKDGINAHLHLAPLPMVRRLDVDVKYGGITRGLFKPLLQDEVRRRMRSRPGSYLPWSPDQRNCKLYLEKRRVEEFLHDEGYFDAVATIEQTIDGVGVSLDVEVQLGSDYSIDVDRIQIPDAGALLVPESEIRAKFTPKKGTCLLIWALCLGKGSKRFTRAKHQEDLQEVVDLFHKNGFPAVRVRSNFDPGMSIDRDTHTVQFQLTIDPRRGLQVVFEGDHTVSDQTLTKQLTFDKAASGDDVEANNSARAIADYLQSRGFFDARVTWKREPFPEAGYDKIIFRIEQGRRRRVASVAFVGNTSASARFASLTSLRNAIATKQVQLRTTILGSTTYATSASLASDVERIVALYRRNGFRDARVKVEASTTPDALGSAALTAALLSAGRGGDLHVRFTIDEGKPTLLTEVHVELGGKTDAITDEQRPLCLQVLRDLSELYHHPGFATPVDPKRCFARAVTIGIGMRRLDPPTFREDEVAATKDQVKNKLFARGRPRAEVAYEPIVIDPHAIGIRYTLKDLQELKVGKIVIRGNFRTRDSVILGELKRGGFYEGNPLTTDALGESIRRLRSTALFDSVNIQMPALATTTAGGVGAVVEITERYDFRSQVNLELGYSSFNGAFVKLLPGFKNLFGVGISLDLSGTVGLDLGDLFDNELTLRQLGAEATLRIPSFLSRRLPLVPEFLTELTGFHRRQETPRFGLLRTTGATISLSRTWERQRFGSRPARAITTGFHYDFRSRERNVDALRESGADDDDSQVPITTRTGSIGATFEWEQRVDRSGSLSPLAPQGGFRFEILASIASPLLFGQDTFIKTSVGGSKFWSPGPNFVLRADMRYDHGIPLAGAALLPEVERFFAGGDSTVRGYDDDRLATEIVQVGVPPLENISQIRILPAGGNIRLIGSVDAQLRIYRLLSTALFVDAGIITNQWSTVTYDDIRPSIGMALLRIVTPFGSFAFERAVPLRPRLGDDPRGRWHISFAARAQF